MSTPLPCRLYRRCPVCILLLFCLSPWILPTPLWAQRSATPAPPATSTGFSADQLVDFADRLMREGEYFRAISEYRRFLFAYPGDRRRPLMHFRIGIALYRGQRYEDALRTFREVARRYPETPYARQARLWQGESLMRLAQYGIARQIYTDLLTQYPQGETHQQARYQRGWTLLYQRRWQEAADQFRRVTPESSLYPASQRLAAEVLDGEQLPQKSPLLAGFLSGLLPGSGQLYNGRPGDALLSVFLNGLFVAGIVEAIGSDALAIAGVLSFFEAGWYTGNLYSAISGAHKHNRHVVETFIRNLENRFRLQPPEAQNSIGLRLSLRF